MNTVNDTFTNNGITRVLFIVGKDGDRIIMKDFTGKRSVLDHQHYAKVFSKVVDTVHVERYPVTLDFTLDGWGWFVKTAPFAKVDLNAAYAAFLEALNLPD